MGTMKFGYGKASDVSAAITAGTIDEKDLVLTKDTSELIYIKDDKTQQFIRPRLCRYDNVTQATADLNQNSDTYAGQIIAIKDATDGKYYPYVVQQGESAFTVELVASAATTNSGMVWTEF